MLIKITYNGLRKEKSEIHCLAQSNHRLQPKKLKNMYLNSTITFDEGVKFFRVKTKKPTRVVLKAPFHYKIGKHRLSLQSYRYVKLTEVPTPVSIKPSLPVDFLKYTIPLLEEYPNSGTSILQPKYTKGYINELLDKNFFII